MQLSYLLFLYILGSGHGLASPHISRLLKSTDSSNSSFIAQITSSVGALIMPFVLWILMSQYGLQGSYLMFSGIILNYLPLVLASAYDIEIYIPNIKWRVRKKSSQYYVSKQEQGKESSIESFNNSLEPDLILKVNNVKEFRYKKNKDTSEFLAKEMYPIGRKRSDTRGNDLPSLEMNKIMVNDNEIYPKIDGMLFEGSFCNKDIIQYEREDKEFKKSCNECHKLSNNIKVQDKTMFNATKHDFSIKNEVLPKISEYEIVETVYENEELQNDCLENNTRNNKLDQAEVESTSSKINKGSNIVLYDSLNIKEKEIPIRSDHEEKKFLTSQKSDNVYKKEAITLSPHPLKSIPVDIKVHVEEYTVANGDEYWRGSFTTNYLTVEKCRGVNGSNSVSLNMHESIKTISHSLSQRFISKTETYKPKLSNTHSVSEIPKSNDTVFAKDNRLTEQNKCHNVAVILGRTFKLRNMILSPVCMCIILMTIILQTNLVLLLTVFADFANKIDQISPDFKWILVAFGFGGFIGKLCCKISWIISEKSHTVCVILYLLTGLATAGILYSPSFNWLTGFYCVLGALESGIMYTISKLILEYTSSNIHHTLSFLKSFMSGITIICFPYVIGKYNVNIIAKIIF